jgi:pyrroloquinoline quinone biosynthesis protein B
MRFPVCLVSLLLFLASCEIDEKRLPVLYEENNKSEAPFLMVLGNVQDGGSPHIGCTKKCCEQLFLTADLERLVTALGLIDPTQNKKWLIEASPDISRQLHRLNLALPKKNDTDPDGIFLTHAHIGHYSGLMYLGREAMGAKKVPVYAMPRMKSFLENNGPWSQLVKLKNIIVAPLEDEQTVNLGTDLSIKPFTVPHRDEFSEAVGFIISGPSKKALFIPDIDKWSKWEKNILDEIKNVDYALVDGTFYDGVEINNRDIAEIPHPFVSESMELLKNLGQKEKGKVWFIHFNHTNPLLDEHSAATKRVESQGFHIARKGRRFIL